MSWADPSAMLGGKELKRPFGLLELFAVSKGFGARQGGTIIPGSDHDNGQTAWAFMRQWSYSCPFDACRLISKHKTLVE